jgi:HAE1 family hydrophobic/amphiphilic exporter-1
MSIPEFAVRRPVTVLMIFCALILFGLFSLTRLPIDLFPEIELPTITVITTYPGASALEVEEKVTRLLEGQVAIVTGIKDVRSSSKENISVITCEFHYGTDLDEAAAEIRSRLEFVRQRLPADADDPMVLKINTAMFPVVMVGVYREEGDIFADYDLVEDILIDPLKSLEGVGNVTVFNATPRRIEVRLDRDRLEQLRLTIPDIVEAIRSSNLSAPAGSLDVGIEDYALELSADFRSLGELRSLVVGRDLRGGVVYLRDVAEVVTAYPVLDEVAIVNGRPCLFMMVNKRSGANTVEVASGVKEALPRLQRQLPRGVRAEVVYDLSAFIVSMIDNLTRTVYLGGLFVLVIVFVFLRRVRSSLIIAATIPASMVVAFGGLALFGYTINMFSLMSMAVAIGMVVDNAIVVLENISRHRESGVERRRAAALGGSEVSGAVAASTLTSVSIFGPLVFISGFVGVLFNQLAFVVIIVLSASLLAALLLTPALAAWFLPGGPRGGGGSGGERVTRLQRAYGRLLGGALRRRWLVVVSALGLLVVTVLIARTLSGGFMPKQDVGDIQVVLETPVGTTTTETGRVARRVLELMEGTFKEWVTLTYIRAGVSEEGIGAAFGQREAPNIAEVFLHLVPVDRRPLTTHEMAEILRPKLERIPEIRRFSIMTDSPLANVFSGGEKPLTIRLKGPDLRALKAAAERLAARVAAIPGTVDVSSVVPEDRPEMRVELDRLRASRMGLPVALAATALRAGFYGMDVGTFRSDGTELDIHLRLAEEDRSRPEDMLRIPLRTMGGAQVTLGDVGRLKQGVTPIEIQRVDQQRAVIVEGDVAGRALGDVMKEIDELLASEDLGRGITTEYGGDIAESRKTSRDFMLVLIMGILLVYMVMAGQFESFLDPLVIMMSVPFAFTGVFLLLAATGTELSVPAFMGLIMLMGIVVNNAIVLIDYIKQLRAGGMALFEAIVLGGQRRLRPVIMTTLTTISGMMPMALAGGEGHEMWRPMGIAVIGGLLVSTLVTLVIVPTVYSLSVRLRGRSRGGPAGSGALGEVMTAEGGTR